MNITVFGASGGIGGEVVRQAAKAGHRVTAVVRVSSPYQADDPSVTLIRVPGLSDAPALVAAVTGADAVISAVGPRGPRAVTVASTSTRGILGALELTGTQRFLAVSAVPVGPVPPGESFVNRRIALPLISRLLRGIYGDLAVMEHDIMASGTQWTIVRPPRLSSRPYTGKYRLAIGSNVPRGRTIGRADVAAAMLSIVDDPSTIKQPVGVAL